MLSPCKICRREYTPDLRVKLRHGHEQGLCPDCLFLCRRQNQLEGPEKTILRILHEHLVRQGVADEKSFVLWNDMPSLAMLNPPKFWSESIFGFFLKRQYMVTYVTGGNREQVGAFSKKLHAVFAPDSDDNRLDFPFDSGHLTFHVGGIAEVKRPENNPSVRQFQVFVTF